MSGPRRPRDDEQTRSPPRPLTRLMVGFCLLAPAAQTRAAYAPQIVVDTTRSNFRCITIASFGIRGASGQITPPGADRRAGLRDTHGQTVHPAVERVRGDIERILMVQLVGDALEGCREIARRRELE